VEVWQSQKDQSAMKKKAQDNHLQEAAATYGIRKAGAAVLDVKSFCEKYALKRDDFTRLSGFSARAVALWAAGAEPAAAARKTLVELGRLFEGLEHVMTPDSIGRWLTAPNNAFGGSTPLQVIERGESDRLWRMIYHLESGQPG
jgi:DNA-binding transcriptional regulator YiaG